MTYFRGSIFLAMVFVTATSFAMEKAEPGEIPNLPKFIWFEIFKHSAPSNNGLNPPKKFLINKRIFAYYVEFLSHDLKSREKLGNDEKKRKAIVLGYAWKLNLIDDKNMVKKLFQSVPTKLGYNISVAQRYLWDWQREIILSPFIYYSFRVFLRGCFNPSNELSSAYLGLTSLAGLAFVDLLLHLSIPHYGGDILSFTKAQLNALEDIVTAEDFEWPQFKKI